MYIKGNPFIYASIVEDKKRKKKKRSKNNNFSLPLKYENKNLSHRSNNLLRNHEIKKENDEIPQIGKKIRPIVKKKRKKKIKRINDRTITNVSPYGYSKKQKQLKFETESFPGVLEVNALIKSQKKKPDTHELLPQISFMTTYIAPRNSGKTNNLVTFLTDSEFCYKKFDFLYIWSSTFDIDPTWKIFKKHYKAEEEYRVFKTYYPDEVQDIFDTIEEEYVEREGKGQRQKYYLFIFDDMGDQNICNRVNIGPIEAVAVKGRHYNVSGIILVQKRSMLSRAIRANTTNCIVFDLTDNREMTVCSEESRGELSHDEFMHIYKYCTHEKHNFLHINYQADKSTRYRKNWNEIIHTDINTDVKQESETEKKE